MAAYDGRKGSARAKVEADREASIPRYFYRPSLGARLRKREYCAHLRDDHAAAPCGLGEACQAGNRL